MNYEHAQELVANAESLTQLYAALRAENADDEFSEHCYNLYTHKKAWSSGTPAYGLFELTPLCNLDCKMCYVRLSPAQLKGRQLLSTSQWADIMSQAADAGLLGAVLSGGECLTYPGFEELYLLLYNKGVRLSVYTNALLLDENRVEFFKRYMPEKIQITLYGHNDDVYERVTGHRVFGRVFENILRACDSGLPVSIAVTPSKYLGSDDEALLRFLAEQKLNYSINAGLITPNEETGRAEENHDMSVADYIRLLCLQRELCGGNRPEPCEVALPEKAKACTGDSPKGLRCGGGHCAYTVDWQGRMYTCTSIDISYAEPLKTGFVKAWDVVKQTALEYPIPAECEGCAYQKVSLKCVGHHEADVPKGHASPRICEYCREIVRSGLKKLED